MISEISGKITLNDHVQYLNYRMRRSFFGTMSVVGTLSFLLVYFNLLSFFPTVLYMIGSSIAMLLLAYLVVRIILRRNYLASDQQMNELMIQISEEGIQYGIKENLINFQWSDIRKVIIFKGVILLHISTNRVLIIPKHFFSSLTEEEQWITFIKKYDTR